MSNTVLKGTVVVEERGAVRIHSYVAPESGWLVNTQIVEGPTKLVLFDAQLLDACAEEVAGYAAALGKPVERIVISHGHPDHWAGLGVLTRRFPGVPVTALGEVTEMIRARGAAILGGLRGAFGDAVAAQVVVPDTLLAPGEVTIDGVDFEFRQLRDAEADLQLVALLPRQGLLLAFDLVFAAEDHLFTVVPHFSNWIGILQSLKALAGTARIRVGHGVPTEAAAIDATIAYLEQAARVHAAAADAAAYAAALKAAFPQRRHPGWVDFSARLLYARR